MNHTIVDQVYNSLTIIEMAGINPATGDTLARCKCVCGDTSKYSLPLVMTGKIKSCGCSDDGRVKHRKQKVAYSYIGKVFNKLTIKDVATNTQRGNPRVVCTCECGNETTVILSNVKSGRTKSCGCLRNHEVKRSLQSRLARQAKPPQWTDIQHGGVFEFDGDLYQVVQVTPQPQAVES